MLKRLKLYTTSSIFNELVISVILTAWHNVSDFAEFQENIKMLLNDLVLQKKIENYQIIKNGKKNSLYLFINGKKVAFISFPKSS